jgi:hypothetical protein
MQPRRQGKMGREKLLAREKNSTMPMEAFASEKGRWKTASPAILQMKKGRWEK